MYLPMRLVLRDSTGDFMKFKRTVFTLDDASFVDLYERTAHVSTLQGKTDLNDACVQKILASIAHDDVLEVGCGRGYLANQMQRSGRKVTACDIAISDQLRATFPEVTFSVGDIERLSYEDGSFDTVVCTHTLEHVRDLQMAIAELRRVARRELIIVVPRQRPYKYTFSLHTQFFPYGWSITAQLGHREGAETLCLDGDWYYREPIPE